MGETYSPGFYFVSLTLRFLVTYLEAFLKATAPAAARETTAIATATETMSLAPVSTLPLLLEEEEEEEEEEVAAPFSSLSEK